MASQTDTRAITVQSVADGFVGEVTGIDLSRPLDDTTAEHVRQAHRDYPVLSFPDQTFEPEQFLDFAALFGPPEIDHHVAQFQHPGLPALIYLTNVDRDGNPDPASADRGSAWHSDSSYKAAPCAHTILYAQEMPDQGGGTLFADMHRAYQTLPEDIKARIDGQRAIHRFSAGPATGGVIPLTPEQEAAMPMVEHPIVRPHPETGRESLYVNPLHTCGIAGMADRDGRALLDVLFDHALKPEFQYLHKWRIGELVIWDQRCTMHRAEAAYAADQRRILMRTKIAGAF